MNDDGNIPVLTDLIEKGIEITITDLGLDDEDLRIEADDDAWDKTVIDIPATDPLADNPALEQAIRQILDQHMERALQEIKLAIRRELGDP